MKQIRFLRRYEYEYLGYSDRNGCLCGHLYVDRFICSHGDRKYSVAGIHNYPPDIQEEYFKTHERVDVSYRSGNVILTKGFGVLLFTCILLVCALVAGAKTFWQGFLLTLGLMAWIGIYDTAFWTGCCSPICRCSGWRERSTWTRPTIRSGSMRKGCCFPASSSH